MADSNSNASSFTDDYERQRIRFALHWIWEELKKLREERGQSAMSLDVAWNAILDLYATNEKLARKLPPAAYAPEALSAARGDKDFQALLAGMTFVPSTDLNISATAKRSAAMKASWARRRSAAGGLTDGRA